MPRRAASAKQASRSDPDGFDRQRGIVKQGMRKGMAADLLRCAGGLDSVERRRLRCPRRVGVAIGARVRRQPVPAEPALIRMDKLRVGLPRRIAPALVDVEVPKHGPSGGNLISLEKLKGRRDCAPDIRELSLEVNGEMLSKLPQINSVSNVTAKQPPPDATGRVPGVFEGAAGE